MGFVKPNYHFRTVQLLVKYGILYNKIFKSVITTLNCNLYVITSPSL